MTVADLVIIIVLAVFVALILFWNHRRKKKGSGCAGCSGCSGCPGKETCHSAYDEPEEAKMSDRFSNES